jgi:hypothetical protein
MPTLFSIAAGADVSLVNGDLNFTIATSSAGQQPNSVVNEDCLLTWSTQPAEASQKITIETDLLAQHFVVTVLATGVSAGDGTSAGTVTLGTTASNLIVGIPFVSAADPGSCTLHYTASATAAEGTGTDNHRVTYTILDE